MRRKALLAGVDMDMEGDLYLNDLAGEVKAGRVPIEVVDESVRRILRVKFALGLFEHPYTDGPGEPEALDPADVELVRTAAEQSFVLLKNDPPPNSSLPVLPLADRGARRIALIGPLADASHDMLGAWAGRGSGSHVVTLRSALTEYANEHRVELLYAKGTDIDGTSDDGIAEAVAVAQRADIVLLAVGESARETGEAASRTQIGLPGIQPMLVDAIAATGKPIVLLVFSGRPLALTPYVDKAAAVVQAWHPGIQAGPALVRVLSGESNFTGRLTVSMPRSVGQLPLYYNHLNTGRPPSQSDLTSPATRGSERFVSRYIDQVNAPLYPFGYGLSYTRFEYTQPILSAPSVSACAINEQRRALHVTAEVRNVGDRDGVEVVQLYIRERGTSVARPVRELKGFERIALARARHEKSSSRSGATSLRSGTWT